MNDITPREPHRPLLWPDLVLDLHDLLVDEVQQVYVVGGAVRDALLQRRLTDLDLAVARDATALARRIANALRGDFFVMDTERDVGRALVDTPQGRMIIDVARFRGDDLLVDLMDRDFTMNAMAVDLTSDISLLIDPLGGEQAIRTKVLRRCSPHALADDPIRALRAVRQSVQFEMRIEPDTLNDVRAAGLALAQISPERLRDEFFKLLSLSKNRTALRVAEVLGLLTQIVPEAAQLRAIQPCIKDYGDGWQERLAVVEKLSHLLIAISPQRTDHTGATFGMGMLIMQLDHYRQRLQAHIAHEWPNARPHSALLALAGLLVDSRVDEVEARAQTLRLSNGERSRLARIVRDYRLPLETDDLSALTIHRFWRRTGEAGVDICLLAAAYYLGSMGSEIDQQGWLALVERLRVLLHAYYEQHDLLVEPPVLLDGDQLMAKLGITPGPMIGALLDRIREGQVTGEVQSVEDALSVAQAALHDHHHK